MNACFLAGLLCLSAVGAEETIDAFDYPTDDAARAAWRACDADVAIKMATVDGRRELRLEAPFARRPDLERVYIDRDVKLDLTIPGEFVLLAGADAPSAAGDLTLYFRSGPGWYAAAGTLDGLGLKEVRFPKAAFRTEGRPGGWDRIEQIRISAWQGEAVNATLRIARLSAPRRAIAVVAPDAPGDEAADAARYRERIIATLERLGLAADTVRESDLARGALAGRCVVILPHNPGLSAEADAALARAADQGVKVFVCYQLPPKLGAALGFGSPKWFKQDRPGEFAEIRFDAADLEGFPKSVRQASWNVVTAEPTGHDARAIGHWFDDQGNPTGKPAMLVSRRGAFLGHVLLEDDPEGKTRLLGAALARLAPSIGVEMARYRLDAAGRVGHCPGAAEALEFIRAQGKPKATALADRAKQTLTQARSALDAGRAVEAQRLAERARGEWVEAYLRAQPSPKREARAWWNHSGTGAYPGDWDRTARELSEAGFNMIFPNMLWAGVAHYPSDLLPRSQTFEKHGDQIAQCVAAARKHGIEVHVWKVNHYLSGAPREFVASLRREGRTQVSVDGRPLDWLCPSHPENFKLERDTMLEVARKYEVDGLHFDYIRYPNAEHCYCDGCRARFEADSGRKARDWPRECHSGARADEYRDWRCRQITRLVAAVHDEAKKIRPGIRISAAVFGSYPSCRRSIGQDWVDWAKSGHVDFLCPMDYTNSDSAFATLARNQLRLVEGRVPLYPGIGATSSHSALPVDRVVGQIHLARSLGAGGFTIFNLAPATAESLLPGIALGVGAEKAAPPHARPGD
ncbi:MAG: family 10 glycosylhydrolase [Pirellulales bacterium]|nr:family 10 glycosylhydrolase [Pirellulales bacterium]